MTTLPAHDHPHSAHGDGHDHPPHLAHHWENPKQQFEAGKLGMWLFLATEVLLFGGLFCAYSVWRGNHPELFKYGSHFLDTKFGAINTAVLILSSLTMAWGVTCAQKGQQNGLRLCLVLTLAGAVTFMVIKYFEYKHKFEQGWFPGAAFYHKPPEASEYWAELAKEQEHAGAHLTEHQAEHQEGASQPGEHHDAPATAASSSSAPAAAGTSGSNGLELTTISIAPAAEALPKVDAPTILPAPPGPSGLAANAQLTEEAFKLQERHSAAEKPPLLDPVRPQNAHMFFNIYFMMTGLHGIHVVIGMIVIGWLLVKSLKGDFSADYWTPVDLGGLYWHIVDLIWIFLFPLFYLI